MPLPARLSMLRESPLAEIWDPALAARAADRNVLDANTLRDAADWSSLDDQVTSHLIDAAARISADPDLAALAWVIHHGMFIDGRLKPRRAELPDLIDPLGDLSGPFYLAVALSAVPAMRDHHRAHGIPDRISRTTARDIAVWVYEYTQRGIPGNHDFARPFTPMPPGLHIRGFAWISRSLTFDILRVERLQFIHAPFRSPFNARRHKQSGEIAIFAEPGLAFDAEGLCERDEADGVFQSPDPISGFATRIGDHGRAIREPVPFAPDDWETLVAPGDPILEIHIPEDGPMDFTLCGASFREAVDHYTEWYPDRPFNAFACGSWLLDPQFQDYLADSANLVRFQRASRLFPARKGPGRSGLLRIFESDDLPNLPRDTSMRRGYLDHLAAGKGWWGGGCFVLPQELHRWPAR